MKINDNYMIIKYPNANIESNLLGINLYDKKIYKESDDFYKDFNKINYIVKDKYLTKTEKNKQLKEIYIHHFHLTNGEVNERLIPVEEV